MSFLHANPATTLRAFPVSTLYRQCDPAIKALRTLRHERHLWIFAIAAFFIGASLRFSYPEDIEYKHDERWMFETTQAVAGGAELPVVGMPSSQGIANPGLSVWAFIGLQKVSGAKTPVQLAQAVQAVNVAAILLLLLFIALAVPPRERAGWVWGAGLVCVSPLSVLFHRKIWAQSVLPLFAMVFIVGWWYRKKHWSAAFVWGATGALLGQVHMAGFFLAAAVLAWTVLFDPDRKGVSWASWSAGSMLGALSLIPWFVEASRQVGHGGPSFHISAWFNLKWWNYWVSNSTGLTMEHSLGAHFWSFLKYPLIGRQPTYLVAVLHVVLALCTLYVLWLVIRHLRENRGTWSRLFIGRGSDASFLINSYFWGCGILITAFGVLIQRHYLLVAFPLTYVWFARFLADDSRRGARVFAVLWSAQLLVSLLFLYYIHANGGAPSGDYGASYSAATR